MMMTTMSCNQYQRRRGMREILLWRGELLRQIGPKPRMRRLVRHTQYLGSDSLELLQWIDGRNMKEGNARCMFLSS